MKIKIGNNNTIKNSNIGDNKIEKEENNYTIMTIFITIITGIIVAGIVYYLGWS